MIRSETKLLSNLRVISRYFIYFGILSSLVFSFAGEMPMSWQITLTLFALTIGIPHGAVDHLITVPKMISMKMVMFISGYLAVVGVAIWAILSSNLLGFQLVVLMSAVHFGLGDAAFIAEIDKRTPNPLKFPKLIYVIASGFTPVLIPLVSNESSKALEAVNSNLVGWANGAEPLIFVIMFFIATVAIVWMLLARRLQEAIDLSLLLVLVNVAPPLVAFSFYFGLWHALRHTGRVSLELPKSREMHVQGKSWAAFRHTVLAGLPALAIVLIFTLVLGLTQGFNFNQEILWYLLVVIWALTVPHMALTLKLDVKALSKS